MPSTFDFKFTSDILFSELYLTEAGWEVCQPGHTFGPAVRDYFLIHYITSGKGEFIKNGKTYHLTAGTCFIIFPSEVTTYAADFEDPWTYYWVGFSGSLAMETLNTLAITLANPIQPISASCSDVIDCIKQIHFALTVSSVANLKALGLFLLFLSMLSPSIEGGSAKQITHKLQEEYLSKAIHFIQDHYADSITIIMIANHIGIDRSYLYRIFQTYLHMGPQDYILSFRIHKSAQLLIETNTPIGSISGLVGFSTPTAFGVAFKKTHKMSPRAFRTSHGSFINT